MTDSQLDGAMVRRASNRLHVTSRRMSRDRLGRSGAHAGQATLKGRSLSFRRGLGTVVALGLLSATVGCDGAAGRYLLFGDTGEESIAPAVAMAEPNADTQASPGAPARIRWADVAETAGTVVTVRAVRRNNLGEATSPDIILVDSRDAFPDGESDLFEWNIAGVRVGSYEISAEINAPDGKSATSVAGGRVVVITALPVPTLTFVVPGAFDVNFPAGGNVTLSWTDNGPSNTEAKLSLGLDLDFDHEEGDEIFLLRDQDLSAEGTTGNFSFTGIDENGAAIPAGTYVVFALLDDGANDPVFVNATGRLIIAP